MRGVSDAGPPVRRTISFRLGCLVASAVAVAVLTLGLATAWHELGRFAAARRETLLATASAFSAAVAKPVAAGDARSAREALRAIGRLPGTVEAEIFGRDGALIANLGGAARLSDDVDLTAESDGSADFRLLVSHTVKVAAPIVDSGREIGRLTLVSETGDLLGSLRELMLGLLGAGAVALAVGLSISLRLQRGITRPLTALAAKMTAIRKSHEYDDAIEVEGDDETAALASSFNGMIAEIRERDRALTHHKLNLEREVEARTVDLSLAKSAAEAANAAKSSFLATMSHEIRTPMNGMLAMAELLAASQLPSRERRYAEVIARSGQSLVAIIDDILDLSKIEAGKLDLESAPVSVVEVLDTVAALFAERARGKGLDLATFVSAGVPETLLADPVRLTQIVSNLANNALKFTETGHVLLRAVEVGGLLRIEVVDTGIGIAADKLDTIFASFSQAEQSTTRRFGGTGLGLSICSKLVEAMDGGIGVESRPGIGSTFWVELPIRGERPRAPSQAFAERAPGVRLATRRGAVEAALREALAESGLDLGETSGGPVFWIGDAEALIAAGARPAGVAATVAIADDMKAAEEALSRRLADRTLLWPIAQADLSPLLEELRAGRVAAAPQSATAPKIDLDLSGARVLVADDSPLNLEVAREALQRFGAAVETVGDGRAAAAAIRRGRFDLVLMDGSMPDIDGFEATRMVRAMEAAEGRPRTVIVALTAHVLGDQAQAWMTAGMDDVLHKPLTLGKLEQCLRRWVGDGDASSGAAVEQRAPEGRPQEAAPLLCDQTLDQLTHLAGASGGAFLERAFQLFAGQAARTLEALDAAADDPVEAARLAHALKSVSLNIGAVALAGRLAAMERTARELGEIPTTGDLLELRALLERSQAALERRLVVDRRPDPGSRAA